MSSPFQRTLPTRPDLEQQKTQAKELLRSFTAGDAEATARVRAALPDKARITLADAQFVLAREYGFVGWTELKAFIDDARTPQEEMRDAFRREDASAIRRAFQRHPELRTRINDPIFSFDSPAIVAFAGNDAIVDALLEFGADPNRKSDWWAGGFHALYSAKGQAAEKLIAAGAVMDACAAAHLDRLDVLARLIADDPSRVHERGGDGQTPLHFARSLAAVDLLLDSVADIDAVDVDHRSTAAEWMLDRRRGAGRYELARYLVERGAKTDIFLAAAFGLTDRVRSMLEADTSLLNLRTGQGDYGEKPPSSYHIYFWTLGDALSPLDVAAQFEQGETLSAMLAFASPVQDFLYACRRGDEARARAAVRDDPGLVASLTPSQQRVLAEAAWHGDARAVRLMLDLGFDPRVTGQDSGTPLHLGAWIGSVDVVEAVLRHPAAASLLTVKDAHHGGTPLGWCTHGSLHGPRGDHAGVARLLLAAGAKPGTDSQQASPEVKAVLAKPVLGSE